MGNQVVMDSVVWQADRLMEDAFWLTAGKKACLFGPRQGDRGRQRGGDVNYNTLSPDYLIFRFFGKNG